jgi:hypothetical protein
MFRLYSAAIAAALAALLLTAAVYAGDITPNVKTGLWQSTISMQSSGELPISDADLAKIPPERRQQFQAAMQAALASAAQPHVWTSCVTAEQLRKGLSFKPDDLPSCTRTVVSSTASTWEMHEECTGAAPRTVSIRFHASSPAEIDGKIATTITRGDRTMNLNGAIHGKWLSANCGSIKPGASVPDSGGH